MTAAELRLYQAVHRRANQMTPELAKAILDAFQRLRDSMSEAELAKAIQLGGPERVVQELLQQAVLDVAMQPVRERTRRGILDSVKYHAKTLPVTNAASKEVILAFDYLSPHVVEAIRQLETRVITTLSDNIRETVRDQVAQGLTAGQSPRTVAKGLRDVIGLAPNQRTAVENLRRELTDGEFASAKTRALLDKRFNLAKLDALSASDRAAKVDTIVEQYRKSFVAFNAETNARTAALDSQKLGQRLSYETAADQGLIDRSRLMKRWVGVMDSRERPEHRAMEGDTVPFDEPFKNGEMIPGESTYNCRCVPRYFLAPAT